MKTFKNLLLLLATLFSSCAVNRTLTLNNVELNPAYSDYHSVLIVVQEKRQPVLQGQQKTSWCGRNGIYNIQTESGKPLSAEFTETIVTALKKKGNQVESLTVDMRMDIDSLTRLYASTKKEERLVLITINHWETNCTALFSSMRYEVISGFTMTVFDQSGKLMATADVSDTKIAEQGAGLNMKVLQKLANVALEEQMKKLFNTPDIKASLQRTTIQ